MSGSTSTFAKAPADTESTYSRFIHLNLQKPLQSALSCPGDIRLCGRDCPNNRHCEERSDEAIHEGALGKTITYAGLLASLGTFASRYRYRTLHMWIRLRLCQSFGGYSLF